MIGEGDRTAPAAGEHAPLSGDQRRTLLALARRAVVRAATKRPDEAGEKPPGLDRPASLFVTLRVAGELRGCIGSFEPQPSLWTTVFELAAASATQDPRFPPITPMDLEQLSVEISVLSPPQLIASPAEVVLGKHGVEIRNGVNRGVLLPQVAAEHGLDAESLLAETCHKAGLPRLAWRDPGTEIRVFEAEIFSDRD